jgi:hypothetical protein
MSGDAYHMQPTNCCMRGRGVFAELLACSHKDLKLTTKDTNGAEDKLLIAKVAKDSPRRPEALYRTEVVRRHDAGEAMEYDERRSRVPLGTTQQA